MTPPPPTPDACENTEDNPNKFAAQSIMMASSSVQAGLLVHCRVCQERSETVSKKKANIETRVGDAGGVQISQNSLECTSSGEICEE